MYKSYKINLLVINIITRGLFFTFFKSDTAKKENYRNINFNYFLYKCDRRKEYII